MPLLKVENISYSVEVKEETKKHFNILKNVSFDVEQGEILGICGESGGGKSTLAKIIAGLIKPTNGKINLITDEKNSQRKSSPIQILFQNNGEILNPFRKVQNIIDPQHHKVSNHDILCTYYVFHFVNYNESIHHNFWQHDGSFQITNTHIKKDIT